jgi:hypothetical protein
VAASDVALMELAKAIADLRNEVAKGNDLLSEIRDAVTEEVEDEEDDGAENPGATPSPDAAQAPAADAAGPFAPLMQMFMGLAGNPEFAAKVAKAVVKPTAPTAPKEV